MNETNVETTDKHGKENGEKGENGKNEILKQKRPDPVFVIIQDQGGMMIDKQLIPEIHDNGYFGILKENDGFLFLYPEEIMIFSERKRLVAVKNMALNDALELISEIKKKWSENGYKCIEDDKRFLKNDDLFVHFNNHVPDFWEKYVVYRDLKNRGYIVRRGIEDISHFRVFKKGEKKGSSTAKFIYFSVFEGKPLSLFKLHEISEYAFNNRQNLILAVVDRHMDISYYHVKKQDI
ncbi:MAG: hypothetical protein ACTSRA_11120 [Promethearchaeota archaeon]